MCLKCNTHPADPRLQFPPHRPLLMCQAYRCICTHLHPWQPCHCFCRADSGRCGSHWGTALWPCGGTASSPRHTGPPSPALTGAAATRTRGTEGLYYSIRWYTKINRSKSNITFILLFLTVFFITSGNDPIDSTQFEYTSQLLSGEDGCMSIRAAVCSLPPPFTSTFGTFDVLVMSTKKFRY